MKTISRIAFLLLFISFAYQSFGQLKIPKTSAHVVAQQDLAFTTVKVDYHSPSVQGREVWGKLVPYNDGVPHPWRAGANNTTIFSVNKDVFIEGQDLPAGDYGLHMIPRADVWTIIFSSVSKGWGSFQYDKSNDVLRVKVKPVEAAFHENLSYNFSDRSASDVTLALFWDTLQVPIKISIDLETQVFNVIEKQLAGLTGSKLRDAYGTAAFYCLSNGVELERGLNWVDRGLRMSETYILYNYKARILQKMGKEKEAAAIKYRAFRFIGAEKLHQRALTNLSNGKADSAMEKFQFIIAERPYTWYGLESKAHKHFQEAKMKDAVSLLTDALKKAPDEEKERMNKLLEGWKAGL